MSTRTNRHLSRLLATALAVAVAGVGGSAPAMAAPAEESPPATEETATPAPAETPAESAPPGTGTTVQDAVEGGDLATAAQRAEAARKAEPTPEHWHVEGQIHEQLGDYERAAQAYAGEVEALPEDATAARQAARGDLQRVRDAARGRVADEPASTHRAEFDEAWAPPAPEKTSKTPAAPPTPADEPREKIVRKWYFWVTIAAIAASAAAVTGIAIKASRDERRDALDLMRGDGGMQGPALFRF